MSVLSAIRVPPAQSQEQVAARAALHASQIQRRPRRPQPIMASVGAAMDFEEIYRAHHQRVYYLCLRMVGSEADAEELTQDVFLQVFRKLSTFRGDSALTTWLHRVAVNTVLMRLRKKFVPIFSLDAYRESKEEGSTALPGAPDVALETIPNRVWVEQALPLLSRKARIALLLRYAGGYSQPEIARMMGYSVSNAKTQLRRARARLRHFMRPVEHSQAAQTRATGR